MGIQEDIFEGFFKKLEEDKEIPDSIIKGLKILKETDEISSKEKLLELIKTGCGDANKD